MARPSIVVIGDSLTHNIILGVPIYASWPAVLARILRGKGYNVCVRNLARSGRTTATGGSNMGDVFSEAWQFDPVNIPKIAIVMGGVNDPGNGITADLTRANLRAIIMGWKFGADQIVAGFANLPARALIGSRKVVLSDSSTTGGAALPSGYPGIATVTGAAASSPTVWECRYSTSSELGWGRIAASATTPTHISKIIVVSAQYLNYSSMDTVATPYAAYSDTLGVPYSSSGVRRAQIDAAADESVVYCDFYDLLKQRIVSGVETQNSYSWHVETGNQHLNAHGESLCASAVFASINSQGWLSSLV